MEPIPPITYIVALLFVVFVLIFMLHDASKERLKLEKELEHEKKSWAFCKRLLDDARKLLTKEQKETLTKK